jgi:hypothetical protein
MLVARRYGLGSYYYAAAGSADIPTGPAGITVAMPQNSSLTMLHRQVASYSSVQMLSALQRYQTQLTQNEAPSSQAAVEAAGQANVPDVNPPTSDPGQQPLTLEPAAAVIGETVSDGSGDLVIPGKSTPYGAPRAKGTSSFLWTWGPPVVAVGGLFAAIFFLTRKKR